MKRERFFVEQVVGILKQAGAGVTAAELWRQGGHHRTDFYRWKKQDVGLEMTRCDS